MNRVIDHYTTKIVRHTKRVVLTRGELVDLAEYAADVFDDVGRRGRFVLDDPRGLVIEWYEELDGTSNGGCE